MRAGSLPWQSFPGIFSSIDRHTKEVILRHLEREGRLPPWMAGVDDAVDHLDPPHWSKFKATDEDTGVTLRGEADAVFLLTGGVCAIVDYKTSRYNSDNRSQNRVYRAQLNAYAWIAQRIDFPPVARLFLAYMEPATSPETMDPAGSIGAEGFTLGFRARLVEVELNPQRLIPPLLRRAAKIHALSAPPVSREGCRDCAALEGLVRTLAG